MLTQENDVEIHALAARGWNQSAISRHTGRDRKTVRKYLTAGTVASRERAASCLEPWRAYIAARFVDDPHLPAVTLLDELTAAGFDRSYPTLVRELRRTEHLRRLRDRGVLITARPGRLTCSPAFVPAPTKPVPVRVATLDGTVIDAGQFTYR